MKMNVQRPQDAGELIELFRRQRVSEMPLDGPHMGRSGPPEDPRSLCGQDDLSTAAVRRAFITADQTASLHPFEVMG